MRRIIFDPAALSGADREWWIHWAAKAKAKTEEMVQLVSSGRQPTFYAELWTDLKRFLLKTVFHGKCAYCESRITDISYGDADHYRPKNRVRVREDGTLTVVYHNGAPHPGYYWLAYNWENLLPACSLCNSAYGKVDQFPINGQRSGAPNECASLDELDILERPILLHPYRDEPSKHIRFGDKGTIAALNGDERGRSSIDIYDLRRGDLITTRQEYQERAWLSFLNAWGRSSADATELIRTLKEGIQPHSVAALNYVEFRLAEMNSTMDVVAAAGTCVGQRGPLA